MIRRCLLLLSLLIFVSSSLLAQQEITGKVTDESNDPIVGANVIIKGTNNGTITDMDGAFKITAPEDASLLISFVGYATQEIAIAGNTNLEIVLLEDAEALEEVVVTALGVKKETKALSYSVTELKGKDIASNEISLADGLAGKVAGVNVSNIGSGVGGSTRVIIRGNTSLAGNNQPLYIVDGVPIDNTQLGSAGKWGGSDFGDGISSLNAEDIESLSVLKGGAAAALYGSRASNGVVVITTKSGTGKKGLGIEFNSNYSFEKIYNHLDLQTSYGHGDRGQKPTSLAEALDYGGSAWGAALDGSQVLQFDGVTRAYSNAGDNYEKFFRTGSTFTNTLSLTGGNGKQSFRFSASNLKNYNITPNSDMDRKNFSLNVNSNWAEKLTLSAKVQYIYQNVDNRARLSDAPGNSNFALAALPPSINVEDLKGPTDKLGAQEDGTELGYSSNIWSQNPYWAAYQFSTKDKKDRLIGSAQIKFDITDWLFIRGRVGMDSYTNRRTTIEPYGTAYKPRGGMEEQERKVREINMEALIGANKTFGDFSLTALVGANKMERSDEMVGYRGNDFNIPFFHTISNAENQSIITDFDGSIYKQKGINSVFGSAEFSFKNFVYISATGRNDWFSTLDPNNNSIFYPSIGASFIVTEAIQTLPNWVTFGKLRAAWAQVGGDTDPYQTSLTYSLTGQGHNGAALGRITQGSVPNNELKPLTSTEIELGFDVRFFNNRLGFDYTYYTRTTTDDILKASISEASGYGEATVNVGEVSNKGHELLLTGRPIDNDFKWDVTFNFAYNNNEVIKLVGDNKVYQAEEARAGGAFIQHRIPYNDDATGISYDGGYSVIVGYTHETMNGQKVYTAEGYPVRSSEVSILGNGVHPYTLGITNNFTWKNFRLGFLVDMKFGGDIYTGTNLITVGNGMNKMTLEGRESGLTISGVDENGAPQTWNIAAADVQDYWGRYNDITDYFVQDASFIKLRQLTFGYDFPKALFNNLPISSASLSFVARNLLLIYSNVDNVDPESTYNSSNGQGLEYFGVPQTRSFGFNLNIKF